MIQPFSLALSFLLSLPPPLLLDKSKEKARQVKRAERGLAGKQNRHKAKTADRSRVQRTTKAAAKMFSVRHGLQELGVLQVFDEASTPAVALPASNLFHFVRILPHLTIAVSKLRESPNNSSPAHDTTV